jgi:hypothetical protein
MAAVVNLAGVWPSIAYVNARQGVPMVGLAAENVATSRYVRPAGMVDIRRLLYSTRLFLIA